MTTPPPQNTLQKQQLPGQAGRAGKRHPRRVCTSELPPLKSRRNFRFSTAADDALNVLVTRWKCTATEAVELSLARTAAWVVALDADDVCTPQRSNER